MNTRSFDLQEATRHYLAAMLWLLTDDDGMPLDHLGLEDVESGTYYQAQRDVARFIDAAREYLEDIDEEQIGHDFYLTRNGHGTGFWDRNHGERGRVLTAICAAMGEVWHYQGDDGLVYGS